MIKVRNYMKKSTFVKKTTFWVAGVGLGVDISKIGHCLSSIDK